MGSHDAHDYFGVADWVYDDNQAFDDYQARLQEEKDEEDRAIREDEDGEAHAHFEKQWQPYSVDEAAALGSQYSHCLDCHEVMLSPHQDAEHMCQSRALVADRGDSRHRAVHNWL